MDHLGKLIDIGGPSLSARSVRMPESVRREAGAMAKELEWILDKKDGFFAFESSLHVLPLGLAAMDCSLLDWNKPDLWRDAYGGLAQEGLFFAEDVFGNQFCMRENSVYAF